MIAVEQLYAWRCANPTCVSHREQHEGQIVMRGSNAVGWYGEGFCHHCHHYTLVSVEPDGVHYVVRSSRVYQCGR